MNNLHRMPIRGGSWNNGGNAGLAALNLNNPRSNSNSNIGFRPASEYASSTTPKGACPCAIEKDAHASAIAETSKTLLGAPSECLYSQIAEFDNLITAANDCRRGKRSSIAALKYFEQLEENSAQIQNELTWHTYNTGRYTEFYVTEPKRRLISAPSFRDRVVHRAIHNVINPIIDPRFIDDSYACRAGKGTHKAARRAQAFLRRTERTGKRAYALKADISKYFASIDHETLKTLLRRHIDCSKTLSLLDQIIDQSPSDAIGAGIPLGNLTSQLFANIYLNELDRYVKHVLRAKQYARYMDDFIIIGESKAALHEYRRSIEAFLWRELRLTTNSKTQVFPVAKNNGRALDFVGYRIYSSHILLRKCTVKRIKRKLAAMQGKPSTEMSARQLSSWLGHANHASTFNLISKLRSMYDRVSF